MLKIAVYSTGRSDFDRYLPILNELRSYKKININLKLILSKAHFIKTFGFTYKEFEKEGFSFHKRKIHKKNENNLELLETVSSEIIYIGSELKKYKPNLIFVLGDRYEVIACPIAAMDFQIPVVHLYGGAVTLGAQDELIRHAVSKLSHLHFVAHDVYKKRLIQLGEENWRIENIGVPALKMMKKYKKLSLKEMLKWSGIDFSKNTALVTFHPVTLEKNNLREYLNQLFFSLKKSDLQIIFSYPNADKGFSLIIKETLKFVSINKHKYKIIKNANGFYYSNLLRHCSLMVGNTSSGLVESSVFKIPVVNIGTRQFGKIRGDNVIDVSYKANDIIKGINTCLSKKFIKKISKMKSPYIKYNNKFWFTEKIVKLYYSKNLLLKKFIDINYYNAEN